MNLYDLFYFEGTGGDLVVELLKQSNNRDILKNIFINPSTSQQWKNSVNKKIVCLVNFKTQTEIAYKNRIWFFKHFDNEVFFNSLLGRSLRPETDENNQILISNIDEFKSIDNQELVRKIVKKYRGHLKSIVYDQDFDLILEHLKIRFYDNNSSLFKGYINSTHLDSADVIIDLLELINSNGKILFDKLSLPYNQSYSKIVRCWQKVNMP